TDIPARRHLYALRGRGRRVSRLWALCQTSGVLLVYLPAAARRRVNGLSRSQPQSTPFSLILPASPILSFLRLLMLCPRAHRSPVSPLMSLALGPTKLRRLQRPTRHTDDTDTHALSATRLSDQPCRRV
ncbi:hypothetical protein B0H10DRAFT_2119263, partial [Mycena sp. CBHHK59/15]